MGLVSKKEARTFKRLMECFVDEVERGTHPQEAGWISEEADRFIEMGLAEKGEKGIRIRLNAVLGIGLDSTDRETIELINICIDIARAMEVEGRIALISKDMTSSSDLSSLVLVGWWKMLETSDFPVFVDSILREGFSPDEWYIEAPKASLDLALAVVRKWWTLNDVGVLGNLSKFGVPKLRILRTKRLDDIRKVLRWDEMLTNLSEEESKALAFLWLAEYLLISNRVCYTGALTFVEARSWNLLEKSLNKERSEIIDQVGRMIESLPSPFKIGWTEIIRFPW